MDGNKYVCMACWEEFDEEHTHCPACGDEMSPDAKVPAGALYATYQIRTNCERCGQPMPLNGPQREVLCQACQNTNSFGPELWKSLLEDFVEERADFGWADSRSSTVMSGAGTFKLVYGRQMPHCPQCHKVLPAFDIPVGTDELLTCRKCEAQIATFPAPEWLRQVLPAARQLYGAEREVDGPTPVGAVEAAGGADAARPIVMQCPQCGGALKITAQSERLVPCEYCQVDVYLPDEVWRRLHPVKTADRWMMRFEVPAGEASAEAAEADEPEDFFTPAGGASEAESGAEAVLAPERARSNTRLWAWLILTLASGLAGLIYFFLANSK